MENFDFGANEPCESCAALRRELAGAKGAGDKAQLGYATNEELLGELHARLEVDGMLGCCTVNGEDYVPSNTSVGAKGDE